MSRRHARGPRAFLVSKAMTALLAASALAGCYHVRQPPQIDEPVKVDVVANEARLVQAQGYLQRAIGDSLVNRLGWRVSPEGSARLEIAIADEHIDAASKDSRDITVRWSIRVTGTALLCSQKGNVVGTFSGVGYSSGLVDENEALKAAAENAAFNLSSWLEVEVGKLK